MEFDLRKIKVEPAREGREDCEFAREFAGTIKRCSFNGYCKSRIDHFGGCYNLCEYGIMDIKKRVSGDSNQVIRESA